MGQKVKEHFVYAICDFNNALKYIGLTDNPIARYKGHLQSKNDENPKNKWLINYLKSGYNLKMYILFSSKNRAYAAGIESFIIDYCINSNIYILNKKERISDIIINSYPHILPEFNRLISEFDSFEPLVKNENILWHRLLRVDKESIENIKYERIGISVPIGTIELVQKIADKEYMSISNLARKYILDGIQRGEEKEIKK